MEKAHDVNTQDITLISAIYRVSALTMSKTKLIVATAKMAFIALMNIPVKILQEVRDACQ